jgi:RNase P protein component
VVRDLRRSYYAQIRSLLRARPDLRRCLKRCRHCRILFLTDPRNAGHDDLRCGFGCREAHRRQRDTRRTRAYYRAHPEKKRGLNRRRYLLTARAEREGGPQPQGETAAPIVHHVRLIVSLIERRPVALDEILRMLAQKERQHRMGGGRGTSYGERRIDGRGS